MCSLRLQEAVISSSELDINEVRNNYGSLFRDPTTVQQFPLPMCATAMDHQARSIYCAKHPNQPVPLELIIPDIMLTDIPKEYKIEQDYFDFDPSEENRLGSGGAAKVFKANYKGVKVAVKQFHSQGLKTRCLSNISTSNISIDFSNSFETFEWSIFIQLILAKV